jgi:hypothetical protein
MYYLRIVSAFFGPIFIFMAGAGFSQMYAETIGIQPTRTDAIELLFIGLFMWAIVSTKTLSHIRKNRS